MKTTPRAFTILELLIASSIGFLIILFTTPILLQIQKLTHTTREKHSLSANTRHLYTTLAQDFSAQLPQTTPTWENQILTITRTLAPSHTHQNNLARVQYYLAKITLNGTKSSCLFRNEQAIDPQSPNSFLPLDPSQDEPIALHVNEISLESQPSTWLFSLTHSPPPSNSSKNKPNENLTTHHWQFPKIITPPPP